MIKSISYEQTEIINGILQLHVPSHRIDCDCTYSKGNFYNNTGIEHPKLKFDLFPQTKDTIEADARHLPIEDASIDCLMFDPPFLATTGASLKKEDGSNKINKRFGVFPNEFDLHEFYIGAIQEANRVLTDNGIYIFKCQDKVSSGKQYMSHCFIHDVAINSGFIAKDLFILLAQNRIVANWQLANQKNARKFHSYFWVFQKTNKKIQYIR